MRRGLLTVLSSLLSARILKLLLDEGEMYLSEIAERLDANPSSVLKALRRLEEEGYVVAKRRGKMKFYKLTERGEEVANWLARYKDFDRVYRDLYAVVASRTYTCIPVPVIFFDAFFKALMDMIEDIFPEETVRELIANIAYRAGKELGERLKEEYGIEEWTPELYARYVLDVTPTRYSNLEIREVGENEVLVEVKECLLWDHVRDNPKICLYARMIYQKFAEGVIGDDVAIEPLELISSGGRRCLIRLRGKGKGRERIK